MDFPARVSEISKINNRYWSDNSQTGVQEIGSREKPVLEIVDFVDKYWQQMGDSVLDVGCAAGHNLMYLADEKANGRKRFDVFGFDVASQYLEELKDRIVERGLYTREDIEKRIKQGDVFRHGLIDFDNESIDTVIARGVLHISSPEGAYIAMGDIYNILKPDGLFLLNVRSNEYIPKDAVLHPLFDNCYCTIGNDGEITRVRTFYDENLFRVLIGKAGFEIVRDGSTGEEDVKSSMFTKKFGEREKTLSFLTVVLKKK